MLTNDVVFHCVDQSVWRRYSEHHFDGVYVAVAEAGLYKASALKYKEISRISYGFSTRLIVDLRYSLVVHSGPWDHGLLKQVKQGLYGFHTDCCRGSIGLAKMRVKGAKRK